MTEPGIWRPRAHRRLGLDAQVDLDWLKSRVIGPGLAIVLLVAFSQMLPASLAAARGDGIHGVFVAEEETCGRGGCSWDLGTFTSDDGELVLEDVFGPEVDTRGDQTVALYVGELDTESVYSDGSKAWIFDATVIAACTGYLAWCVWWLFHRRGKPRAEGRGRHAA